MVIDARIDVAIVGGSYAGISAALPLARARRRVVVFDSGRRRNRFAARAHGLMAQDGRPPGDILDDAREQLMAYPTVEWVDCGVDAAAPYDGGFFQVQTPRGRLWAQRLLLATGVVDHLPEIPGLQERWGKSVFHCPYCHGYELQRGRIGVIATGPASLHQAMLLPEWGSVTLFPNDVLGISAEEAGELQGRGVRVQPGRVTRVSGLAMVHLDDDQRFDLEGIFVASRTEPASNLAEQLGCEHEEGPLGRFVKTGAMKETTVPGVFACGDLARPMGNVALAVGDGALAGAAVHRSLVFGH
ncbi:NAD(P)/FAD-dependent oxidoreductase [Caenimonas soli]|uniref:NAD(P)/FAD-dependent oxidoreductase n=1 Tax=Caenimonas soli TaxID=2735555 RepID=UPI001554862F|nr:NAD(P)/FAD-dependent oxidoreductase [Caenimonas soli]NPC57889.1 NAD(P)/FAD-dependent oxidoreductase [Caenimonas soli]